MKLVIRCEHCIKNDTCRYIANYKMAAFNIHKANTSVEEGCNVPLEDVDYLSPSLGCSHFIGSDKKRAGL